MPRLGRYQRPPLLILTRPNMVAGPLSRTATDTLAAMSDSAVDVVVSATYAIVVPYLRTTQSVKRASLF